MVYIGRDGRVYEKQPYNLDWFLGLFIGFWAFICSFFSSLLAPLLPDGSSSGSGNDRRWGGGGGSGPSGGGGRPGANRRIGRVTTISDCTVPGGG